MNLVQLRIRIEFDDKNTSLHTPARKVFTAFGGRTRVRRPKEPGAEIKIDDVKAQIDWDYETCLITLERTEKVDECIDLAVDFVRTVDSVVPIAKMKVFELGTRWIFPTKQYSFNSLNELYIQRLLSRWDYMQGTFDTGVILDIDIGDWIIHHESGPMEPKQLLERFLRFKRENLPKAFIFLHVSGRYKNVIQYSEENIRNLIEKGLDCCKLHSTSFTEVWREYL